MSDADFLKNQLRVAADKLKDTANEIQGPEGVALEDIGTSLNRARAQIDTALHIILRSLSEMRDARQLASSAMVGSQSQLVEEGMVMIGEADLDQTDMVEKMHRIKDALTQIITGILSVAVRDKDNDAAKLRAAAGRFEGQANTNL